MNRQERRQARKNLRGAPAFVKLTREQRMQELVKNGITPEYVDEQKRISYREGFDAGVDGTFLSLYAGVAMALHDEFGFGIKRIKRLLRAADTNVCGVLTEHEALQEVWDNLGLRLFTKEGFDRLKDVEVIKDA